MENMIAARIKVGRRPKRSATRKLDAHPKNAPPWKVETMFDDRFALAESLAVSRPYVRWKEGRLRVPPMNALSYPYMAAYDVSNGD
jgi:hypothetical protein